MGSIGSRLRDERERLELNQSDFAVVAGTTRKSQFNYESDARRPDADYLAAIAAAGVDVLFVLTGQRSQAVSPAASLPPRARALLDNYEATDEEGKRFIERAADHEAQSAATGRKKAARGGQ